MAISSTIDVVIIAQDDISAQLLKIEKNIQKFSKKLQTSMKNAEKVTTQAATNTAKSLGHLNTSFGNLTISIRRFGAILGSIYAIRTMATAISGMSDDFIDLQEQMHRVNTIAQETTENLGLMTDQVEEFSIRFGQDASKVASALYDIESASFRGAEAIEVLNKAGQAAVGGFTDINIAAKALTGVINAYGLEIEDLDRIADIQFKTVERGVLTYAELGPSMSKLLPLANQLSISFEEVSGAMATLTRRGISSSEAGTMLVGVLNSLVKPSDKAKDTIERLNKKNKNLNFQWDITALKAKGLAGLMADLGKATQGNAEVIGRLVPRIRGMIGTLVLGSIQAQEYKEDVEAMKDATGSLALANEEANKSMAQQIKIAEQEWKKYFRTVGGILAEFKLGYYKNLIAFSEWVKKHEEGLLTLIDAIKGLTIAFIALKTAMLVSAGMEGVIKFLMLLELKALLATKATGLLITSVTLLKAALFPLIGMAIVISVALIGYVLIMKQIRALKKEINAQVEASNNLYDTRIAKIRQYKEMLKSEDKLIRKLGKAQLDHLKALIQIQDYEADIDLRPYHERIKLIKEEIALRDAPMYGPMTEQQAIERGLWTKEIPSIEDILGADAAEQAAKAAQREAERIAKVIKRMNRNITEFYEKLNDYSTNRIKNLQKEEEALKEANRKYEEYLEDILENLDSIGRRHERITTDITENIRRENRDFSESMDDRLRKFNETMSDMENRHSDKTEDLKYQIAREKGMGLRADREKIKELEKRLARENRDYKIKIDRERKENNLETSRVKRDNQERLSDFELRLAREKEDYELRLAEMDKMFDREKSAYFRLQDNIQKKTKETAASIVKSMGNAIDNIIDKIRDTQIPALQELVPDILQRAGGATGRVEIQRNLPAEQEFVQNWGGRFGRLPSQQEIQQGVYGTPTPNFVVNINNPILVDEFKNEIINDAAKAFGQQMQQYQQGAY